MTMLNGGMRSQRVAYNHRKQKATFAGVRRACRLLANVSTNGAVPVSKPTASPTSSEVSTLMEELHCLRRQVSELKSVQSEHRMYAEAGSRRSWKLSKEDYDSLPHRIILIRHAESQGNVDHETYSRLPDHAVPLTKKGRQHAREVGKQVASMLEDKQGPNFRVFIMTSPYCRTLETTDLLVEAFSNDQVAGVRQAVQLREQDFGNFQDPSRITQDMSDRQRFGRFWYRFPNGESGADVYDRLTIFEDHLTRDMLHGRFQDTSLILVTHGLTMRLFLMRWFHWSVDEFLEVYNPGNCDPVVVEKLPWEDVQELQAKKYAHAKHCYHITGDSLKILKGCCGTTMASYFSRTEAVPAREKWIRQRRRMAERGLYCGSIEEYDDGSTSEESYSAVSATRKRSQPSSASTSASGRHESGSVADRAANDEDDLLQYEDCFWTLEGCPAEDLEHQHDEPTFGKLALSSAASGTSIDVEDSQTPQK